VLEFDKKTVLIVTLIGVLSVVTVIFLGPIGMVFIVFWFVIPVLIKQVIDYLREKFPL